MIFISCHRCHRSFGRLVGEDFVRFCSLCSAENAWRSSSRIIPRPPLDAA